ncbi:MAG: PP2C family protein-serine/threonine phosphatase [Acidobacteria bacterium]|nr:PP2C family protein-serine/threonine phosphatase [Acidobacteriota bacterium]
MANRDTVYLIAFLLIAFALLAVGRDVIADSVILSSGLTFGGTAIVAILGMALYRIRIALHASRQELALRQAELNFALKVQQALFPRQMPGDCGLDLAAICLPARGISGDYYDALRLSDGRLILAIADISGKGLSAAILMSNLQALLRVIASQGHTPEVVCRQLNHHLHLVTDAARYATLFYAEWHPERRRLVYVNAGHNPPLLLKRSSCRRLHVGGVPLGVMGDADFSTGEELLEPHDLLVFYSDGITEAGLGNGREFSVERLERIVTAARNQPLPEVQSRVLGEVREWTKMELEDDLTLVLARVL